MRKDLKEYMEKHHQLCEQLTAKGYTIQGSNLDFSKCYFSEGKEPFQKIVGYIDNKTLEVVYQ